MTAAGRSSGTTPSASVSARPAAGRLLVPVVVFVGLVVAVIGSLGAPLITAVAEKYDVSLTAAQWTLTIALLTGAVSTPVLGRLGSGPHRRAVVLATLGVIVAGGVLTVLPLPFVALLIGRGAQGVGLGLTALMMATARDHLSEQRSTSTIAVLSVASTAGIGVGYPLAGLLTDVGGLRAAYGLGLAISAGAFVASAAVLPVAPARVAARLDVRSALLLSIGLAALLLVVSEIGLWRDDPGLAVAIVVIAVGALAGWTALETRSEQPLVDVRLLRRPAVAAANLVMLTGGAAMYLLLSLITRFVQTPSTAGYGFDLTTFEAGLILVPFSVLGFVAGRAAPRIRSRVAAPTLLGLSAALVLAALVLFALRRDDLAEPVVAMGLLGAGVGGFSAAMPSIILAAVPRGETASAMGVNQVVRSVGFSIGSALGGLILAGYTTQVFPAAAGYTVAAWVGVAITVATLIAIALVGRGSATTS